jgi:NADPH:quinone reductase-like Zn-dependent oxidoreductase
LKHYGAEVTGVCSVERMDYVKALGADFVIDYKKNDLRTGGKRYNLVFDILGRLDWSVCKEILTEQGIFLLASFKTIKLLQMLKTAIFGNKKVICAFGSEKQSDLERIKDLVEDGKLKTIVDRVFLLEEESKAHDYYEKKLNRGHVILKIV